jgi:hypothetical protein
MTNININLNVTGLADTKKGLAQIKRALRRTNPLMNSIGRALRDDARRRITTQDGGTYDPLSKWTRAQTGRRKALITERKNISFKLVGGTLQIGHQSPGNWSIEQHEKGFVEQNASETITLRNPKALKDIRGTQFFLKNPKPSVVPARKVFANRAEAESIAKKKADQWVKKIVARANRNPYSTITM